MVTKWEYNVYGLPLNNFDSLKEKLSQISEEGWELINVIESPSFKKLFNTESACFAILKKPKS